MKVDNKNGVNGGVVGYSSMSRQRVEAEIGHGLGFRSGRPVPALRHGRRGEHRGWSEGKGV